MIGNLWFALLAFILGAGLTYLRMAGSATRQIAKPVPRRLVMGGIIPGVIDPPVPLPVDVGPEWKIRAGAAPSAETGPSVGASDAPAPVAELAENTKPIADAVAEDAAAVVEQAAPEVAATPEEVAEPPVVQRLEPPWPIEPEAAAMPEEVAEPPVVQRLEPPWPIEPEVPVAEEPDVAAPLEDQSAAPSEAQPHAATEPEGPTARRIAAGATDEPSTSSWWAAAFDRGDPGPYPGPLRYSSAWPPAGSRVLEVDDEFAAALGAGAAASAASAALFGAAHRYAPEPEPVRPERDGRTQGTAPTPPVVDDAPREMAPTLSSPSTPPSDIAEALAVTADELIKGNRDSMLYHTPDSPWYARTTAEEWFHTEQEAQAAGFQRWNSRVNK